MRSISNCMHSVSSFFVRIKNYAVDKISHFPVVTAALKAINSLRTKKSAKALKPDRVKPTEKKPVEKKVDVASKTHFNPTVKQEPEQPKPTEKPKDNTPKPEPVIPKVTPKESKPNLIPTPEQPKTNLLPTPELPKPNLIPIPEQPKPNLIPTPEQPKTNLLLTPELPKPNLLDLVPTQKDKTKQPEQPVLKVENFTTPLKQFVPTPVIPPLSPYIYSKTFRSPMKKSSKVISKEFEFKVMDKSLLTPQNSPFNKRSVSITGKLDGQNTPIKFTRDSDTNALNVHIDVDLCKPEEAIQEIFAQVAGRDNTTPSDSDSDSEDLIITPFADAMELNAAIFPNPIWEINYKELMEVDSIVFEDALSNSLLKNSFDAEAFFGNQVALFAGKSLNINKDLTFTLIKNFKNGE